MRLFTLLTIASGFLISSPVTAQTTRTSTACGQTITYPSDGCGSPLCSNPITITNNGTQVFNLDNDTICVQNSSVGTLDFQGHNNDVIRLCGTNSLSGIGTNFGTGNAFINTSGSTLNLDYTGFGHTNHLTITNYGTLNLSGSTNYDATTIYNVGPAAVIVTSGDFIVNGDDSIFMIGGNITINGTFEANNATALFCMSQFATITAINVMVNSPDEIHVDPGKVSCLQYSGTASANSDLTEDSMIICSAPGSSPIQSFQTWGPLATVVQNCTNCKDRLAPLPIILQSFVAHLNPDNTVFLEWVSTMEINSQTFEIQRSGDGSLFETIGTLKASGDRNTPSSYHYADSAPLPDIDYYRLKMLDRDGKSGFSFTLAVRPQTFSNAIRILANTSASLVIGLPLVNGPASMRLIDLQGRVLWRQTRGMGQVQATIPLIGVAVGNYYVQYSDSKLQLTRQVFIR